MCICKEKQVIIGCQYHIFLIILNDSTIPYVKCQKCQSQAHKTSNYLFYQNK